MAELPDKAARRDLRGGREVTPVPCTLRGVRREIISAGRRGKRWARVVPLANNPCGRSGPAFPRSAVQSGRYPGTRCGADPVYKVDRCGAVAV